MNTRPKFSHTDSHSHTCTRTHARPHTCTQPTPSQHPHIHTLRHFFALSRNLGMSSGPSVCWLQPALNSLPTGSWANFFAISSPSRTQCSRKYSTQLIRSMSGAAATMSGDVLKRDSIAASTGNSFRLSVSRPCLVSSASALPSVDENRNPDNFFTNTVDFSRRRHRHIGNVGTRLPSRKHAKSMHPPPCQT